jgi:hypothetical protein
MSDLEQIIEDTTDQVFQIAGGFEFTDEIAVKLNAKWRKSQGPVLVSQVDLAWLLDGYARSRLRNRSSEGDDGS